MKQKLGLVCTLIHEPELIILDDPPPASILSRGAIAFAFGMWRFRRQFS
jgi:energy-coupling factor transporter ATP-binding protein EcfA2